MDKVFKIADIKDLDMQVASGEITYGRMVEILNEKAYWHYSKVKKLNIPAVIKSVCIAPKGECDRKPEDVCKECECCKYLEQTVL